MWLNVCRSRWSIHLRSVQKKKEDFTAFGQKGGKKYQSGNTVLPIKYSTKKRKKEPLKEEKWNLFFFWLAIMMCIHVLFLPTGKWCWMLTRFQDNHFNFLYSGSIWLDRGYIFFLNLSYSGTRCVYHCKIWFLMCIHVLFLPTCKWCWMLTRFQDNHFNVLHSGSVLLDWGY